MGGTPVSGLSELLATTRGALTVDDLDRLPRQPDDGRRYELVDGSLIVSPAPTLRHAVAVKRLYDVLLPAGGERGDVFPGGAGLRFSHDTELVPDLFVVRPDTDFTLRALPPSDVLMVAEVVSPSNAANDLVLKRALYARYGIAAYWILDVRAEPTMTVLELDGDAYRVVHEIGPDESVRLSRPFSVTLTPAELLA